MKYYNVLSLLFFTFTNISYTASWSEKTLQNMSTEEKIGQVLMVAATATGDIVDAQTAQFIAASPYTMHKKYIEELIISYHVGGVIFLGKSTVQQQIEHTNAFQSLSKTPLWIGLDCEYGLAMRLWDVEPLPHALSLGATRNPTLTYEIAHEIGKQCKKIGVHIAFAPVADINTNSENPIIGNRSFGENKEQVAVHCLAFMKGLHDAEVMACAKHFPGHGGTFLDSHEELPRVLETKDDLDATELYPFKQLIARDIKALMTAHIHVPAYDRTPKTPASLSKKITSDLLKKSLGFDGLVFTDGMGMKAVTKYHKPGEAELKAFMAGADIILCPVDVPKVVEVFKQALANSKITMQELDQKVLKILQTKEQLGLTSKPTIPYENIDNTLISSLSEKVYKQAITLVCNNARIEPLKNYHTLALVQFGGILPSTFETILKDTIKRITYHYPLTLSKEQITYLKNQTEHIDHIVISLFNTDQNISESINQLINEWHQQRKKISLVIFGTPYVLNNLDEQPDSIIVAYENTSQTQTIAADCLLGKHAPQGCLPLSVGPFCCKT